MIKAPPNQFKHPDAEQVRADALALTIEEVWGMAFTLACSIAALERVRPGPPCLISVHAPRADLVFQRLQKLAHEIIANTNPVEVEIFHDSDISTTKH